MRLNINQIDKVISNIKESGKKLIYVAGASASGKSYFTKQLAEGLRKQWNKVLEISSDDYYTQQTGLKYLLYGTFDHPNLIEYPLLQKNVDEYLSTGKTKLPKYSFVERRRTEYVPVNEKYDYVIVEWLYTISQLNDNNSPYKIFVDSAVEELIFRRLVRDQERTKEGLDTIVSMLGNVFPMWRLYGDVQRDPADMIIDNDFSILSKSGEKVTFQRYHDKKSDLGKLQKREYITDFVYDDSHPGNGVVVVSEVYREKTGLLDGIIITKSKIDDDEHHSYDRITMKMYDPGMLTVVHSLLQNAGLSYLHSNKKIESTYQDGEKIVLLKESHGKMFIKKNGKK